MNRTEEDSPNESHNALNTRAGACAHSSEYSLYGTFVQPPDAEEVARLYDSAQKQAARKKGKVKQGCKPTKKPPPHFNQAKRLLLFHVTPLLTEKPERFEIFDLVPKMLHRMSPKALEEVSLVFFQKYRDTWQSIQDSSIIDHQDEMRATIKSEDLKRQRALARQFPKIYPGLKPKLKEAFPILLDLAAFRGSTEFTTQGFFYLSARDLAQRLLMPHNKDATRMLAKFVKLKILRVCRRGLSWKEAFALQRDPKTKKGIQEAAGFQILV